MYKVPSDRIKNLRLKEKIKNLNHENQALRECVLLLTGRKYFPTSNLGRPARKSKELK